MESNRLSTDPSRPWALSPDAGPPRVLNACTGVNTGAAHSQPSNPVESGTAGSLEALEEKSTGADFGHPGSVSHEKAPTTAGQLPALTMEKPMTCTTPVAETAQRVLAHLQAQHAQGLATTAGRKIVTALRADAQTVKYALGLLVAQGQVEEVGRSVYRLTSASLPAPVEATTEPPAATATVAAPAPAPAKTARTKHTAAPKASYRPAPGTVGDRILNLLADEPMGLRASEIVRFTSRSAESELGEMTRLGWVVRLDRGLYKLGTLPEPRPGSAKAEPPALGWQRPTVEGLPLTAAETALTAELAQVREALRASPDASAFFAAERVRHQADMPRPFLVEWDGRVEIVDAADEVDAASNAGVPDDEAEEAGLHVESTRLTAAHIKYMLKEANEIDRKIYDECNAALDQIATAVSLNADKADARPIVERVQAGYADIAAVRLLVQARDGESTAGAVVQHLAKLDHHVEVARESSRKAAAELAETRRGCERLRREAETPRPFIAETNEGPRVVDACSVEQARAVLGWLPLDPDDDEASEDAWLVPMMAHHAEDMLAAGRVDEERIAALVAERDELKRAWAMEVESRPARGVPVREAARRRMAIDGADAQALEGALAMTERERDAARRESESAKGLQAEAERVARVWQVRADKAESAAFRATVEAREATYALRRIRAGTDGLDDVDATLNPRKIADRVMEVAEERWTLQERVEVAEERAVHFAQLWARERRRADGLERVASRRPVPPKAPTPVAPGPTLLGPAIAQVARDVLCNAACKAIEAIADQLGIDETNPARVAGVVSALVDDLDSLGEAVAGPGAYDPAQVVEVLRKELGKIPELRSELTEERAALLAYEAHVRELAGDLAVVKAEVSARAARVLSRAFKKGGAR
jgi:hypothetical protein